MKMWPGVAMQGGETQLVNLGFKVNPGMPHTGLVILSL
eukprot:COSAG04_NODE_30913_length_260_cov_0.602484_1_plen_37_part_10